MEFNLAKLFSRRSFTHGESARMQDLYCRAQNFAEYIEQYVPRNEFRRTALLRLRTVLDACETAVATETADTAQAEIFGASYPGVGPGDMSKVPAYARR